MSNTLNIHAELLHQLQQRAKSRGVSVDTLLAHLLESNSALAKSLYAHFDVVPSAIAIVDILQAGQPTIYVNSAFERHTGYSAEEVIGRNLRFLQGDDRDQPDRAIIREAIQQRTSCIALLCNYRKDGSMFWNEIRLAPLPDEQGEITRYISIQNDVTERITAQVALRDSEEKYRLIAENTSDGILIIDGPTNDVVYASPAYDRLWGGRAEGLNEENIYGLIHPEDRDRIFTEIYDAIQGHLSSLTYTYRIKSREKWHWKEDHARFIYDESGNYLRAYVISRDITDRIEANDALREREARYKLLTELMSDYAVTTKVEQDGTFVVERVEGGYEAITGYGPDETDRNMTHPDDQEQLFADIQHTIANHETTSEYRIQHKNGEYRWVHVQRKPVWDEKQQRVVRFYSAVTDITEKRRTDELLGLQNTALKSAANAIVITDRDAYIEWVNPAFTRLTGYTFQEARGKNPSELIKSGRHDQAFYRDMWDTILSGHVWFGQLINRRKDGTLYTEEQTITPVYGAEGHISHFIAIKQDVTERERNQQFMLDYEGLKARFQKEQEQSIMIQQTIAALSHDIRTPLSVIATTKDILSLHFDKLNEEQRQAKLANIEHQLQYVIELLDDTVRVVKSNLNHRTFRLTRVNLAALCRVSIEEFNIAQGDPHALRFVNLAHVETVFVDEILVSRILVNLLSNAIKYSPEGGEIRLELDQAEGWLILRVIDQGMGIHEKNIPHIFDPFFRADPKSSIGGTGLGLSIVKDCVERHQGKILVESTPGKGSTFTVKLPFTV